MIRFELRNEEKGTLLRVRIWQIVQTLDPLSNAIARSSGHE